MSEVQNTASQEQKTYQASSAPVRQLNKNRSLLKFILLGIVTLGIYPIVFYSGIANDINVIAGRYDGKKTMHYCLLVFLAGPFTLQIATFVWFHRITNRIGSELKRRNIDFEISAKDYWLWGILGALIVVGPFIFVHKMATATNKLAEHYNVNG